MSDVAKREFDNCHWIIIRNGEQSCPAHFQFFSGTGQKHQTIWGINKIFPR